ncbi:MAG TPA: ATP-binding protein [Kofleriaceae bacterium]
MRFRVEHPELFELVDLAPITTPSGAELWALTPGRITRLSAADGSMLGSEPIGYLDPNGRFLLSSTAPGIAVWHAPAPVVVRANPAELDVPGPGGELILPIADTRWLLWQMGVLRMWRSTIGEAWRKPIGDPGARVVDAQIILEGRLFVLVQTRTNQSHDAAELRVTIAQVSDGAQNTQLRLPGVTQLAIAARRGLAFARAPGRAGVIDLRFGRWIRDLMLPGGTLQVAVDETLQRIAIEHADGIELTRLDALMSIAPRGDDDEEQAPATPAPAPAPAPLPAAAAARTNGTNGAYRPRSSREKERDRVAAAAAAAEAESSAIEAADVAAMRRDVAHAKTAPIAVEEGLFSSSYATPIDEADDDDDDAPPPIFGEPLDTSDLRAADPLPDEDNPVEEPEPPDFTDEDVFPDDPLIRLEPVENLPTATPAQIAQAVELRLQLVGALAAAAIADAWDTGRIIKPDPTRPPFADEVGGLLRIVSGRQPEELATAIGRLRAIDDLVAAAERERGNRMTPLDLLARDFELSPAAVVILFAILAPRLRGELARIYGILANDPGRPLVDEYLLGQLLGADPAQIARELDGDRPLRRHGLVHVGGGDRPFAALTVDPLVVRFIANMDLEGEPDPYLKVRTADTELDDLQIPRPLIAKALRYLSTARSEAARVVVRGRAGGGRHTLLAAIAGRASRALGLIDVAMMPRTAGPLAGALESAMRRAKLRGLVPCVDNLEILGSDDPDLKLAVGTVLKNHPGPLFLRLPGDTRIPLDPGYVLLDIPARNEQLRGESWAAALERYHIDLPDASDLAARYRVGPGIIERVCAEVARRPDRPTDAAAWVHELDEAVRQHLENRLGTTATRVTRLASWADIVLPEDITDALLELTARVRHRKTVFEKWGFDKSMTSSRGITALFQGSPGTGKTMVAGVIARDLGLEVYRVDVSRITSKWIGETEKNLGALFDAAEDGQVMLLFDEADSLFAKRTEVKTSVDRYANMEVNYLLQRLDSFEGIAILTTNFGNSIDPAFKRRLTYRVTFPFPDEEMREQLWRSLLPPQVPISGRIDFASLAQRFRLSGGYIRNAALRAAFLAVEEGSSLTHDHLERAIRMEFREIGKLAETGTLE